ncbi:Uncharacterised protein [Acinetobacter baumannii]|nr:Uncharacterised protein [Acinetobacter baumannii]
MLDVAHGAGLQVGLVEIEQNVAEGHHGAARGLLGIQLATQLVQLRGARVEAGLGALGGGVLQLRLGIAQDDGLLGQFDALVGQVGQLVHVALVFAILVGLVGLGQPVAGVLGFQGRDLGRVGLRLQRGEVAAGLFQVGVRRRGAGGQRQGQQGYGGEGNVLTHRGHP